MPNCFKPYIHVERLNKMETQGLLNGTCYLTTKLDGTCSSVWADYYGNIHTGSRKREITPEDDNAGFAAWINSDAEDAVKIRQMCLDNPHLYVFGEWLGSDSFVGAIKKYNPNAKQHLWIFDMYNDEEDRYLNWEEMEAILYFNNLLDSRVQLLSIMTNPTLDDIIKLANENKFLLEDSDTIGEGVVIKRYDYVNPYGRYAVAKYVREDFRPNTPKVKRIIQAGKIEQDFINRYLTQSELEKAKAKTALACGEEYAPGNGKFIGMFLNLLWKDALEENIVDFCKRAKNPQIDFAALNGLIKAEGRKFLGLV